MRKAKKNFQGKFSLALSFSKESAVLPFPFLTILHCGADEAIFRVADTVLPAELYEGFAHEGSVLRSVILQECSLELFFVIIGSDVDLFHSKRVYAGIKHNG